MKGHSCKLCDWHSSVCIGKDEYDEPMETHYCHLTGSREISEAEIEFGCGLWRKKNGL